MTFNEAIAAQDLWLRVWVYWMMAAFFGVTLILLAARTTRRDALAVAGAFILGAVLMSVMYDRLGYVRLLGLPHLIFWAPLAVYLWVRLRDEAVTAPQRPAIWLLLATIGVSLVFDVSDVARYLLGERAPQFPT